MAKKTPAQSCSEQVYIVRPTHLNGAGRLFGGQLALWIDELAGIVAIRHCGMRVVTAAIDNLRFREPVRQGEIVVLAGRVTYVGRTSMEVRVDSYVEAPAGGRRLINTAFLVEVAIGEDGNPAEVPGLLLQTDEEIQTFEDGKRRKEFRLQTRDLYRSSASPGCT